MLHNIIKKQFLFFLLFINQNIFSAGFLGNTLIKTTEHYKKIDEIKVNESVECFDFKNQNLTSSKVSSIKKLKYNHYFKIIINGKNIFVAPDHQFYCPLNEKSHWIKVKDLKKNDYILANYITCVKIEDIIKINEEEFFYCLVIDKYHNFFITEDKILVHNIVWWIPVFEVAIGGGAKCLLGFSSIASAIAGIFIVKVATENGIDTSGLGDSYNAGTNRFENPLSAPKKEVEKLTKTKREHIFENDNGEKHGFSGGPNDQDPEKWWEIIKNRLKKAYSYGEIQDGRNYEVRMPQNVNPDFGDLVIKGIVQSAIIRIGTAYLEIKK